MYYFNADSYFKNAKTFFIDEQNHPSVNHQYNNSNILIKIILLSFSVNMYIVIKHVNLFYRFIYFLIILGYNKL